MPAALAAYLAAKKAKDSKEFKRYYGAAKKASPGGNPGHNFRTASKAYCKANPENPGEPFSAEKRSRKGEGGNPAVKSCPYCSHKISINLEVS